MIKYFKDDIYRFNEYTMEENGDIFQSILEERKDEFDQKRFFLQYLSMEYLSKFDFSNEDSLREFREMNLRSDSFLQIMGGCNLHPDSLKKGIRYSGIKMSDPKNIISGIFDIRDSKITYSPIFTPFFEDRDLCKFAHDAYFTPMTFEEIMFGQVNSASEFYVHTGNYQSSKDIAVNGRYILEKISKEQMGDFITNAIEGDRIQKNIFKKIVKVLL